MHIFLYVTFLHNHPVFIIHRIYDRKIKHDELLNDKTSPDISKDLYVLGIFKRPTRERPSSSPHLHPVACAHKTTATAIFKPVSHAWQPRAGLQWRKAHQPTEMA